MPTPEGWLLDRLNGDFQLVTINIEAPERLFAEGIDLSRVSLNTRSTDGDPIRERYLGSADSAVYLMRPDQHVAARWEAFDPAAIQSAVRVAIGR